MGVALTNTVIGIMIYAANPQRTQNRLLFTFCNILTAWTIVVIGIIYSKTPIIAENLIRLASIIASLIPLSLELLLKSIKNQNSSIRLIIKKSKGFLFSAIFISGLCMTNLYMTEVVMHPNVEGAKGLADAQYGLGFVLYGAYFLTTLSSILFFSIKATYKATGIEKIELQYVLLGTGLMLAFSFSFSLILPVLLDSAAIAQFGPVSVIVMNLVIAYGIATRKILNVSTVLRKFAAYTILTFFISVIYFFAWSISKYALPKAHSLLAQFIATLTVALTVVPAYGKLQKVTNKLISSQGIDTTKAMKGAAQLFQSVTTIESLYTQFAQLLVDTLGAESVILLSLQHAKMIQVYPNRSDSTSFTRNNAIIKIAEITNDPVCRDSLKRRRQTDLTETAAKELDSYNAVIASGIFSKQGICGLILLGSRRNGRIYDKAEQDALQILCNQFAIALENATLYTEAQDSKIRNDILLNQLVNGVIVVDTERRISLFNREAERITRLSARVAIGNDMSILPEPIIHILEATLKKQARKLYLDAVLFPEEEQRVVLQMGTSFLFGHDQKPMGALLVLNDQTELKSLEAQVRRNDQLSTVGTLAAGMAHEIKNPLVTIKTFTQLLPQRYEDADFREEFSELVASEVKRIDGIVTQLLGFSKPIIPSLKPIHLHQTVLSSIHLIHQKAAKHGITIKTELHAENDFIQGDEDLITQSLVNLYLNAIDAINSAENDGLIIVKSTNCRYKIFNVKTPEHTTEQSCIRLQVVDNGCGIAPEKLKKIFDPFFTSKSEGTGMGLSVVHGILQEHQAVIEVDSRPGKGTTFTVHFPLCVQEARS